MIGAKSVRGQGHNLPNLNGDNRQLVLFERGWVPDIIAMLFYPYMKGHGSIIWVCTTKKRPSSYWWDANFISMEFLSPCFNALFRDTALDQKSQAEFQLEKEPGGAAKCNSWDFPTISHGKRCQFGVPPTETCSILQLWKMVILWLSFGPDPTVTIQ